MTISTEPLLSKLQPCLQPHPKAISLHGAHSISAVYITTPTGKVNPAEVNLTEFAINASVFHTTADAVSALHAIDTAEHDCPTHLATPDGTVTRSLSQRYTVDKWTGWRTITHIYIPADPTDPGDTATSLRLNQEYLVRGNVLLTLTESGNITPGSGPRKRRPAKQPPPPCSPDTASGSSAGTDLETRPVRRYARNPPSPGVRRRQGVPGHRNHYVERHDDPRNRHPVSNA